MDVGTKSARRTATQPQKLRVKAPAKGPDFALERAAMARLGAQARVAGVDEVGRGPLAGPVVTAAAWLSEAAAAQLSEAGLNDSKALTEKRREALAEMLRVFCVEGKAAAMLGAASSKEIGVLNIRGATFLAMRRALARLERALDAPIACALIDGNAVPPGIETGQAVVKGDSRSLSIAAAAVLAKTVRDRAMRQLDQRWPGYGWASNAGYPSAAHREALAELGTTPHHRPGFRGVALAKS